jgi:outer membrane protein assembly factor BamB
MPTRSVSRPALGAARVDRRPLPVLVAVTAAALILAADAAPPGEWTQWRGPERDGSLPPRESAQPWPERLTPLWERDIGEGYSGPVTDGHDVWVHARRREMEVVTRLRLASGEVVWSREYPAPFQQDDSASGHGKGPYATPALVEGRLFTLGIRAVLSAWNASSGDLRWRADYSEEFSPPYPYFGAAASPLVWDGLCFVHFGGPPGGEPTEGSMVGAMVALRVSDGSEVWRWEEDGPALGASPVIREIAGRLQLVFKSQMLMVGVDPRSGRELWRVPFKVDMDNTIVTPLFLGDRLLTSDWEMGMGAWHIVAASEGWKANKLWSNRSASLFTSSPVLAAGRLVAFSHFKKGQLFVMDPTDGDVLWRGEPRWGEHATLIAWGDDVLVFKEDGTLVVGELSAKGFRVLRIYHVARSRTWAHPAIVDDRIVVRDGGRLAVYSIPED